MRSHPRLDVRAYNRPSIIECRECLRDVEANGQYRTRKRGNDCSTVRERCRTDNGLYRVVEVREVGWNGDFLEAQGFAFLAVRSLFGLPISFPTTTGVPHSMCGGLLHGVPAAVKEKKIR